MLFKFNINLILTIYLINFIKLFVCEPCPAAIELSELNFDKFISKFQNTIVKFDIAFPYGEKHDEFCKFCMEYNYLDNLLCALIGVKDYGDKDNAKLAKRYGVLHADDFPAVKLFGNQTKEWHDFMALTDNPINVDNLIRFVQSYGKINIHLKGCIPELDDLTRKFFAIIGTTGNVNEINKIILEVTETKSMPIDDLIQKNSREFYLKLMTKIRNDNYNTIIINEQLKRLNRLKLEKNVSASKLQEFNYKINILHSFQMYASESLSKKNIANKIDL